MGDAVPPPNDADVDGMADTCWPEDDGAAVVGPGDFTRPGRFVESVKPPASVVDTSPADVVSGRSPRETGDDAVPSDPPPTTLTMIMTRPATNTTADTGTAAFFHMRPQRTTLPRDGEPGTRMTSAQTSRSLADVVAEQDDVTGPSGVIVVELDDVIPRRHPDLPNVYVGSTTSPIDHRFQFLLRGKGPGWIQGHIRSLRPDLSVETRDVSPAEARSLRQGIVKTLKSQGYTVNRDSYIWCVYVIDLDPAAAKNPGRGVVYVGETCRTPEERFQQHMNPVPTAKGRRLHSAVVTRHGQRLRMDLAPGTPFFDAASAKRAEAEWADHLRSLGYIVKGGH